MYNAVKDESFYNNSEGGTGGDGWRACQKYLKDHPEEAKKIYQENGKRIQEWRKEHPEEYKEKALKPFLEGSKKYWKDHPEKAKEHLTKMNQRKDEWRKTHPEEYKQQIDEWRKKGSEANSKKVICLTTGEEFKSISEAGRFYDIPQSNISKCLKRERKSAGTFNGEKLFWKFV
jgi:hypothetical protein